MPVRLPQSLDPKSAQSVYTAAAKPRTPLTFEPNLREKFGGVRFATSYRPAFALVESADKRAIIRINSVGPLKPGLVIDLDETTMRYFDPTPKLGPIPKVEITPLPGL